MLATFGKNSQFFKNGNQNPQWNLIGNIIKTLQKFCHIWICWEWMIDVANFGNIIRLSDMECCVFIRHLVIEFANNGKTLKFPKMGCFQFKSLHIWQLLDLLKVANSWPWNIPRFRTCCGFWHPHRQCKVLKQTKATTTMLCLACHQYCC